MESSESRSAFDKGLILPLGMGALSLFGICLLLVINQVTSARTTVPLPDTATPFKFLFLGTEPGVSTLEPEPSDEPSEDGATPSRAPGLYVTSASGISSSGGTLMPALTLPSNRATDTPATPSTAETRSPVSASPVGMGTSTFTPRSPVATSPGFTPTPINLPTFLPATPTISANTPTRTPTSASTPPLNAGTYDDTDYRLIYSNNWTSQRNVSGAYLNTLHVSNTLGGTLNFRFIGREFRIFYIGGASLGTIRINLDGAEFDLLQNQSTGSSEWVSPQVALGTHAVTIRHLSGGSVNIDYVIVPEVVGTSTPTATSTP